MLRWVQTGLSVVAGTAEPEYGPEALHPITKAVEGENPYFGEVTRDDLKWRDPPFTNVETQVFYFTCKTGHICVVQVIHSNLAGLHKTAQFTCRVYHPSRPQDCIWTSTNLPNFEINDDTSPDHKSTNDKNESKDETETSPDGFLGASCKADGLSITLSEDNSTYTIECNVNPSTVVHAVVKRSCPAFKVGKDGTTLYGTDHANPWGTMRHIFWPRAKVTGSIIVTKPLGDADGNIDNDTKNNDDKKSNNDNNTDNNNKNNNDNTNNNKDNNNNNNNDNNNSDELRHSNKIDIEGECMFVHAIQGMKPHHAAARWNFANFQGPTISAIMMEFTTPSSYGSQTVNIGGLAQNDKLLSVTVNNSAKHVESFIDEQSQWPAPSRILFEWSGVPINEKVSKDSPIKETVKATLDAKLPTLIERVDVMSEIPMFVKKIVSGVAGTKPYIFQYANKATINLKNQDKSFEEEGILFSEATFIS